MVSKILIILLLGGIQTKRTKPIPKPVFKTGVTDLEICSAILQVSNFKFMKGFKQVDRKNLPRVCKAIIQASKRWKISPFLIAGVIWAESTFRKNPPSGKICRKVLKYWNGIGPNPPGWPKTVKKCWKVGIYEIGYMQLIWWHGLPKKGYKLITNLEPKGSKYIKSLRKTDINILIGAYEILRECQQCKKKHRHRLSKMPLKVRKFFRKNRKLLKHFCVAHYNWGGAVYPENKIFNQWRYPVKVLKYALKLSQVVGKIRQKGATDGITIESAKSNSGNLSGEKQTVGQGSDNKSR